MKYLIPLLFITFSSHAEIISMDCEYWTAENLKEQARIKNTHYLELDKNKMTLNVKEFRNEHGGMGITSKCKNFSDGDDDWYICTIADKEQWKGNEKTYNGIYRTEYKLNRRTLDYYFNINGTIVSAENGYESTISDKNEGKCSLTQELQI